MNRWGTIGALVLVLLLSGCTLDFLTRDRYLDCDFKGTTLKLSSDGVKNSVDLKPYVSGAGTCEFTVLFPGRRQGFSYLLLDAVSQSTADGTGTCAHGTEQNLIWLKLDSAFHIQDARSVLVDSCLQNIHGEQSYKQTDGRLTMKYTRTAVDADTANVHTRQYESNLSYDNEHPEAGLVVETHEVK